MGMGEEGLTGTGNGLAILQETTSTLVVISGEHSCLCVQRATVLGEGTENSRQRDTGDGWTVKLGNREIISIQSVILEYFTQKLHFGHQVTDVQQNVQAAFFYLLKVDGC